MHLNSGVEISQTYEGQDICVVGITMHRELDGQVGCVYFCGVDVDIGLQLAGCKFQVVNFMM